MRAAIVPILVGVILVGGFVYIKMERDNRQAMQAQVAQREIEALHEKINQVASRYGATREWVSSLAGDESYQLAPIFSVELERAWIDKGPIIFFGKIEDIKSVSQSEYVIDIERDEFATEGAMFNTTLRLSLAAEKTTIDRILSQHEEIATDSFGNTIAVVAKIQRIDGRSANSGNDSASDVRIGSGQLLDIVFVGDALL